MEHRRILEAGESEPTKHRQEPNRPRNESYIQSNKRAKPGTGESNQTMSSNQTMETNENILETMGTEKKHRKQRVTN